jgi:DNA-binding NarL/FixJ family response regulator
VTAAQRRAAQKAVSSYDFDAVAETVSNGEAAPLVLSTVSDLSERIRAGQAAARARGVAFGRPRVVDAKRIRKLAAKGLSQRRIAAEAGVSLSTVRRALRVA